MYPNPTQGIINIVYDNTNNSSGSTVIELFDMQGNIVKSMTNVSTESTVLMQVDLEELRHGMYYVRLSQTGMTVQKPIVKL